MGRDMRQRDGEYRDAGREPGVRERPSFTVYFDYGKYIPGLESWSGIVESAI